jgi:hypothetical protein
MHVVVSTRHLAAGAREPRVVLARLGWACEDRRQLADATGGRQGFCTPAPTEHDIASALLDHQCASRLVVDALATGVHDGGEIDDEAQPRRRLGHGPLNTHPQPLHNPRIKAGAARPVPVACVQLQDIAFQERGGGGATLHSTPHTHTRVHARRTGP